MLKLFCFVDELCQQISNLPDGRASPCQKYTSASSRTKNWLRRFAHPSLISKNFFESSLFRNEMKCKIKEAPMIDLCPPQIWCTAVSHLWELARKKIGTWQTGRADLFNHLSCRLSDFDEIWHVSAIWVHGRGRIINIHTSSKIPWQTLLKFHSNWNFNYPHSGMCPFSALCRRCDKRWRYN